LCGCLSARLYDCLVVCILDVLCAWLRVNLLVFTHPYMHTHTHIHTHTHSHTHTLFFFLIRMHKYTHIHKRTHTFPLCVVVSLTLSLSLSLSLTLTRSLSLETLFTHPEFTNRSTPPRNWQVCRSFMYIFAKYVEIPCIFWAGMSKFHFYFWQVSRNSMYIFDRYVEILCIFVTVMSKFHAYLRAVIFFVRVCVMAKWRMISAWLDTSSRLNFTLQIRVCVCVTVNVYVYNLTYVYLWTYTFVKSSRREILRVCVCDGLRVSVCVSAYAVFTCVCDGVSVCVCLRACTVPICMCVCCHTLSVSLALLTVTLWVCPSHDPSHSAVTLWVYPLLSHSQCVP